MPLAVATFRRGHPDVALTLAEGEPEEIAPRLRAGELRPGAAVHVPRRRREQLDDRPADGPAAGGPDARRAAGRASAGRASARLRLADLQRRGLGPDLGAEPVRTARRAALPGGRVRAERDLRERRLRHGAGTRRRRRGSGARSPARADPRPSADRGAELSPRSPSRKVVAATMAGPGVAPAARTMLRILADVAREYREPVEQTAGLDAAEPARRPRLVDSG